VPALNIGLMHTFISEDDQYKNVPSNANCWSPCLIQTHVDFYVAPICFRSCHQLSQMTEDGEALLVDALADNSSDAAWTLMVRLT
jgi:hypothetical protein